MSRDDKKNPWTCCCGHPMTLHEDNLNACQAIGCDCPFWAEVYSPAHIRRTPRIAVDLRELSPEEEYAEKWSRTGDGEDA